MYYITWFLQFATLLLCNMGFILLGARALKVKKKTVSDQWWRLLVVYIYSSKSVIRTRGYYYY